MTDLPPLILDREPRGVWWLLDGSTVNFNFAGRHSPPGPAWRWADETMTGLQPEAGWIPNPPDPQIDPLRVVEARYDPETGEWVTGPTDGLGQLDTGDDAPNADAARILDPLPEDATPGRSCVQCGHPADLHDRAWNGYDYPCTVCACSGTTGFTGGSEP